MDFFDEMVRNSQKIRIFQFLNIRIMPGKKKITSKDYTNPLRRPGEKWEDLNTQENEKETPSLSTETEKGDILLSLQLNRYYISLGFLIRWF